MGILIQISVKKLKVIICDNQFLRNNTLAKLSRVNSLHEVSYIFRESLHFVADTRVW